MKIRKEEEYLQDERGGGLPPDPSAERYDRGPMPGIGVDQERQDISAGASIHDAPTPEPVVGGRGEREHGAPTPGGGGAGIADPGEPIPAPTAESAPEPPPDEEREAPESREGPFPRHPIPGEA